MARATTKKAKQSTATQPGAVARLVNNLFQPTTLAGLLTIGASLATGGLAGWLNADTLPALLTGVGLIFARDERSLANIFQPSSQARTESEAP